MIHSVVFRPKYGPKLYLAMSVCLAFLALPVFFIVFARHEEPTLFLCAAIFASLLLIAWIVCFTRIRFESTIIVDRFLLPSREFQYSEITNVGFSSIRTTRGRIHLYPMRNINELHEILHEYMRKGLVDGAAFDGSEVVREILSNTAAAYAALIATVLALGLIFVCDVRGRVHATFLTLSIFLLAYGPVYFYLKRRSL